MAELSSNLSAATSTSCNPTEQREVKIFCSGIVATPIDAQRILKMNEIVKICSSTVVIKWNKQFCNVLEAISVNSRKKLTKCVKRC